MTTRRMVFIIVGVVVAFFVVSVAGGVFVLRQLGKMAGRGLGTKSYVGKPLPCGTAAMTEQKFRDYRRGYYRKQLVIAYRKYGKHDPRWDDPGEKYLEATAHGYAEDPDAPDVRAIGTLTSRLVALHCDDPLISSRIGTLYRQAGEVALADTYLTRAAEGLRKAGSSPLILAMTYHSLALLHGEIDPSRRAGEFRWRPLALEAYADAADASLFGPHEQRALWERLYPVMDSDFRASQDLFVQALQARSNTDPWVLNMARAKQAIDLAWAARGTGWASSVNQSHWREFDKYLRIASDCSRKCYELHPEYPEGAAAMIGIVNSAGESGAGSEREWFDRCVAAQFDYMTAYGAMRNALLPRWGGSHEAMLAFGKECLDTGRFDTQVPFVYSRIVDDIAELDQDETVWQRPEVFDNVKRCFEGTIKYRAQSPYAEDKKRARSLRARLILKAHRCGRDDYARRQIETMGKSLDRKVMQDWWGEGVDLLVGEIYARSGGSKQAVEAAEDLFDRGRTQDALSAFQKLLTAEKERHTRRYLGDRVQTLQWDKQFAAGQWVPLKPDPRSAGWDCWGEIKGLGDGNGLSIRPHRAAMAICRVRPDQYFDLRCDVEFPQNTPQSLDAAILVNIADATTTPYWDSFRIVRFPPRAVCGTEWSVQREKVLGSVPRKFRMRLVQSRVTMSLYMDDQPVFEGVQLRPCYKFDGPHHVGLGVEADPGKAEPVIFRNIRIRRVD